MTNGGAQIRSLTAADGAALAGFFAAVAADPEAARFFHPHPLTRAYAEELCASCATRRDKYFALWYDGRIAGYGMLRGWDEGFPIPSFGVCVHPALRDAGIGQTLLTHALAEARAAGATKVRLTVYEANTRAVQIYRRFGFDFESHRNGTLIGTLALDDAAARKMKPLNVARLSDWAANAVGPASAPVPASAGRPFRIGVWCHYGTTLTPNEGIGVFTHNLMHGLLELSEPVELAVLVRPGDQKLVEPLAERAPGRVRVLPDPKRRLAFRLRLCMWAAAWVRRSDLMRYRYHVVLRWLESVRHAAWEYFANCNRALARRIRYGRALLLLVLIVFVPIGFLLGWCGALLCGLTTTVRRVLLFPFDCLDRAVRVAASHPRLMSSALSLGIAKEADCDVWIIPYVGFEYPIDFPAVVFVHDLVIYHFPGAFDSGFVEHLKKLVPQRAREARLCACMSDFIRRNDLLGVLGLPAEKVRMVRPAAPRDFPNISEAQAHALRPAGLSRPYLFFPAAFRGYKNHAGLIEALAVLRDEFGVRDFDLVFTGPNTGTPPRELMRLVRRTATEDRIRVVGRVDRDVLAALYLGAYATLMPSLYEQGSFPVYEALYWGCPVASADIPSMREQCADMGEAMLYFDPRDLHSIARAVLAIRADRDGVRERQRQAAAALWTRTWRDVAAEWLPIFREAAKLGPPAVADAPTSDGAHRAAA
jgi:glycosyltransferase involved in cell wall biosynthesis/ribosomal protein S18 acetylase RimI-like enzyme